MGNRPSRSNTAFHIQQTSAAPLEHLYWFIQVVEAGSLSAAARRTGVGKSSLSRRLMQLERRLNVQLLNRNTRGFVLTTIGEQIYRHALDMLAAAEAAERYAQEASDSHTGLLRIVAPSILHRWLLNRLSAFTMAHPRVQFELSAADTCTELIPRRLDLSLSLESPRDSSEIVSRPLALLDNVIVGTPALVRNLKHPRSLSEIAEPILLSSSLKSRCAALPRPGPPILSADSLLTLLEAARAGYGLACLPHFACIDDLHSGALQIACPDETVEPSMLYALTPSHRGITPAVRSLIQHIRAELAMRNEEWIGAIPDTRTCA
ncbi:LysR family transcriptional regulator [Pseudomonas lopnurensis]|uniref:LysR family transcriptional regulator n=1 Tax=Pseudomonas lopnurensis TaxID=1477517 RepID=UPI00187B0787|nr:LysR family transcriptional regulator [Pseudomonas lopnurensis]MBE7374046.1 LysR family transcriptional regulator [Pseudomonas lopnurensis]